jgi:hypothetical protein
MGEDGQRPQTCACFGAHAPLCSRRGRYHVHRLIERYGIDAKLFDWEPEADCPRKIARSPYDAGGARCPNLSKVV